LMSPGAMTFGISAKKRQSRHPPMPGRAASPGLTASPAGVKLPVFPAPLAWKTKSS